MKKKNDSQLPLEFSVASEGLSNYKHSFSTTARVVSISSALTIRHDKQKKSDLDRILVFAKEIDW